MPVSVYETRVATKTGETEEFLADQMTVHLVPSFVVLGAEYFSDRRDGLSTMNNMFAEISDRYAISQAAIPTDPEWQVRRRAVEEMAKIRALGGSSAQSRQWPGACSEGFSYRWDRPGGIGQCRSDHSSRPMNVSSNPDLPSEPSRRGGLALSRLRGLQLSY